MIKRECEIEELKIKDVSKYNVICIDNPNWIGFSLPMARYLREAEGLKYKNFYWSFLKS
ncbi:MAG: hypothetical protein QME57_00085 [Patescibacteria group bacterium]|nr:hypothetical protein [Patescibacteria group bacterium]